MLCIFMLFVVLQYTQFIQERLPYFILYTITNGYLKYIPVDINY